MKKLILPVFCLLAVYLISCSSETDVDSKKESENVTYVNEKFGFEVGVSREGVDRSG